MTLNILLVEDDEGDAFLVEESLEDVHIDTHLEVVTDGQACLDRLAKRDLPDLVLMDINMPRLNGLEALQAIKADDRLKRLPVVMLTTSEADEDVISSYEHNANAYLHKPVEPEAFKRIVEDLAHFWSGNTTP